MRLLKLHLQAFGPFTNRTLDFGETGHGIMLIHGANEAGKSSTLRAISDLRFGIPVQSKDNFVHEHGDMRIGGEFLDAEGNLHAFIRRKGKGATLLKASFASGASSIGQPASPGLEALLTAGLAREAYETMFALDHGRLRQGGDDLLKGKGDVGAALFEASAGVHSIPKVLERLDETSRKYFMPGARGKNARINQALVAYEERNAEFKKTLVRPMQWAELFKQHQAAVDELHRLEEARNGFQTQLLLLKELKGAAPLVVALDSATVALEALGEVRLLADSAANERAAAEASLIGAQTHVQEAAAEAQRQRQLLETLVPDTALLAMAPAIRRLAASAEAIDQHQRDIAQARSDVLDETRQVSECAASIRPSATVAEVIERIPSKADAVCIDAAIRQFEKMQQALAQHHAAASHDPVDRVTPTDSLPAAELRTALRIALAEVGRHSASRHRLQGLPIEINAAQRSAAAALTALGLEDHEALRQVRPLLPTQINEALREEEAARIRRSELKRRIAEMSDALPAVEDRKTALLAAGVLPTRDDVLAARAQREREWDRVRSLYIDQVGQIDRSMPSPQDPGAARALPEVYVASVREADRLIDALASDTVRATKLQAVTREIQTLEFDRTRLVQQLGDLEAAEAKRDQDWESALERDGLPRLSPGALQDWQTLLTAAHQAFETVQSRQDEFDTACALEKRLMADLDAALGRLGGRPTAETSLAALVALASDFEDRFKAQETAAAQAKGQQLQKALEHQQRETHEKELVAGLQKAQEVLARSLETLYLRGDTSTNVARARLSEFEALFEANQRLKAASAKQHRTEQALQVLIESLQVVRAALGDLEFPDARTYIDALSARLAAADDVETKWSLAMQAAVSAEESERSHAKTVILHQATIGALCTAAGVASAALLPEAEESSRRKREVAADIDKVRRHLAAVTPRSLDDLRFLLAGWDLSTAEAREHACTQEQAKSTEQLQAARASEELARRALEAIDSSDIASSARESMEQAIARVRTDMPAWIRAKLAHALLTEALKRFRERAQGPMLRAATAYFEKMTDGEFDRLLSDDMGKDPILIAQRKGRNKCIGVEEMSEGTRDQLYLALRLAALDLRRGAGVELPVLLDDVLMTSDEKRSGATLEALAEFAKSNQVVVFTHHQHVADIAAQHIPSELLKMIRI